MGISMSLMFYGIFLLVIIIVHLFNLVFSC